MVVNPQGIGIYVYMLWAYISGSWLKFTRLRAGEAVCRAGSNIREIAVSIMRLQIQFV